MSKILGKNIKEQREKRKITLNELSNKTSISIKYLKKIELGTAAGIRISHILSIAFAMNIEPYIIFENID